MGRILGAAFCSHVPRLMLPPRKRAVYMKGKVSTFYEALADMYQARIASLKFDTFIVFDTHWWTTLEYVINGHGRHRGVYTSDEIPWMINSYRYDYCGDSTLADLIADECKKKKMPIYVSRDAYLPVHYPVLTTMRYLNLKAPRRRVLPMSIAYTSSVANELDYGDAIRKAVEKSDRNVVIVATGGLSHRFWDLDLIRQRASADVKNIYSKANREADLMIIEKMKLGEHAELLSKIGKLRQKINAEGRFAHYLRMVGALGGLSCSIKGLQYGEYEAAAGTGQVNIWFDIPNNRKGRRE